MTDEEARKERAQEAGMLHGIDAYNEAMGYDTDPPPERDYDMPPRCLVCGCYPEDCECEEGGDFG